MEPKKNTMQDEATKKTAQDALFSKIYSAKLGYFTDDYSKLFNKSEKKMMPIINRGTWTRVYSVRTLVNNFLEMHKGKKVQILSLGAGLDANYFYYAENSDLFREEDVTYFEVDFQDITIAKIHTIQDNSQLEKLIFAEETPNYEGEDSIYANRYRLIACDIRDTELLGDKLSKFCGDPEVATIVLTEGVLGYMENVDSEKVLKFLTTYFAGDVAVVNFEMIRPNDPFGATMIENLEARGCLLLGLKDVPDEEAQKTRMTDGGFKNAYGENMLRIHNTKLDDTERHRIERLEMFDEFEEWDLLQSHYCICVGSRFADDNELSF